MCGRYNLLDSPAVQTLLIESGLNDLVNWRNLRFNPDCAPVSPVSIITQSTQIRIEEAIWHLYLTLDKDTTSWIPTPKYFSINSRSDKLHSRPEWRSQRCLIPATAFVESQNGRSPHLLEFPDRAFFFGGLYKRYDDSEAGPVTSTTIITLPGHRKIKHINEKAFPLILPDDPDVITKWLDPNFFNTTEFSSLLMPNIRWPMTATPIEKASEKNRIGASEPIQPDWLI